MAGTRYSAASDLDYYDEPWAGPVLEYQVTCVACSREMWVRADEPPPYRCDRCVDLPAEAVQHQFDRNVA